jgi:hypothetical protein
VIALASQSIPTWNRITSWLKEIVQRYPVLVAQRHLRGFEWSDCTALNVIAFDADVDETGKRDDLIACGVVERSPDWLACRGSQWILRIDSNGVRHESDIT